MPDPSGEQLQETGRARRYRRLMEAFSSPDSYGLVLLLILVTYALSAALAASWAASWCWLCRSPRCGWRCGVPGAPIGRAIANIALAAAALAAVANLLFHDQIHGGIVAAWASCLLYLLRRFRSSATCGQANRGQRDGPGGDRGVPDGRDVFRIPLPCAGTQSNAAAVLRVPGPRHALAGPVLLVHHASTTGYGNLVPAGNPGQTSPCSRC